MVSPDTHGIGTGRPPSERHGRRAPRSDAAKAPIRVLVAGRASRGREWAGRTLAGDPRFVVVAQALDAPDAVATAVRELPDICLLDVHLPGSGIAAAWEISGRLPRTRVVMISDSAEPRHFLAALRGGASSFLVKGMNPRRLAPALLDVLGGKPAIPRSLVAALVDEFRDPGPRRRAVVSPFRGVDLTSREWQVLDLRSKGLGTAEVARQLCISRATVRSHIAAARRKLDGPDA
jgi:DNA-binding NarL/FixJ family response regulator